MFQNVYSFHDTVLSNIRFGKPEATMEEVVEAAKKARCHDFIMQLPRGYETVVGEGGSTLSGCGKTTLTRLLNGLIPDCFHGAFQGSVSVNGRNSQEIRPSACKGPWEVCPESPKSEQLHFCQICEK